MRHLNRVLMRTSGYVLMRPREMPSPPPQAVRMASDLVIPNQFELSGCRGSRPFM